MSKQKPDGGPAFPREGKLVTPAGKSYQELWYAQTGMTLRDWFAGMALPALISEPKPASITVQEIANAAYEYADAMLAAREQKEGER